MTERSFLGPTLFTLIGTVLLLGLGTWQIERLHWKEGLIAERQAGVDAPPVPLPATLAQAATLDFRHVAASGVFLNQDELYIEGGDARNDPGFQVIAPLRRDDGTILMVDRGFVPLERRDPQSRAAGEPAGEVTVTGVLRLPYAAKPGFFTPNNDPAHKNWFYVDPAAMGRALGLAPVLPFYMQADATPNPGGWPRGGLTSLDLPNNHLNYAITWYALAGWLVVFYIALLRRRRAGART